MACRPISGRAPAPRPRVSFVPIWILMSDLDIASAWASVFTEMNSTPPSCSSIIRLTALPPPPPTPTTFIRAVCAALSSSSKIMVGSLGPTQKKSWSHRLHWSEHLLHRRRLAGCPCRSPPLIATCLAP